MPNNKVKTPASPAGRQNSKLPIKLKLRGTGKTTAQNAKLIKDKKAAKTSSNVAEKVQVSVKTAKSVLKADVYDLKGKVVKKISLPKDIFGAKVNKVLMTQAVRVYLANQRRGTVSTKTRGEVSGSTRKIYRQKGTGRARHGGLRAPIFVHGGIAFGPKPRDYSLKLSKKMKKLALFSALSVAYKNSSIKVVGGLENISPKTKIFANLLENLGISYRDKKTLFVVSKDSEKQKQAAANIANLTIIPFEQINTYEILKNNTILFMDNTISLIESHFAKKEQI